MTPRIDYRKTNPEAFQGLAALGAATPSIPKKLKALIELRVSQINRCAYCLWLHAREARAAGEKQERLDCLAAFEESGLFDEKECAALAWAEAVTRISETNAPQHLFDELRKHFSDR
jgi:AhpD family alkylhydroperoxidase